MNSSPYSSSAFKRSGAHFLSGKAISALLAVFLLLYLVRVLPIEEYGVYVTLVAIMDLTVAIAGIGLPWLASRYIPEYRLHGSGKQLNSFVGKIIYWHSIALLAVTALLWIAIDAILDWFNITQYQDAVNLFLVIILLEGISRQIIASTLGPLLLQGSTQLSIIVRQTTFISLLVIYSSTSQIHLVNVITIELIASVAGLSVAVFGLLRYLRNTQKTEIKEDWQEPKIASIWKTASHMYFAHMITLAYSPQMFLIVIQRFLGMESAAIFGFIRNLYEQISRYLPATLLFNLIRPKLIAYYVGGGGISALTQNANMAGKLSLFVLLPIIVFTAVSGESFISLVSGGKFNDTGLLFFALMLSLIPVSQRQILETVAVSTGRSASCTKAASYSLAVLPLMLVLLEFDFQLWAPIISLCIGSILFNLVLIKDLRKQGYQPDTSGLLKIIITACLASLTIPLLPNMETGWITLIFQGSMIGFSYLFIGWLIKPFEATERNRLNNFITRPVFVW